MIVADYQDGLIHLSNPHKIRVTGIPEIVKI